VSEAPGVRLVLVANVGPGHVGRYFLEAASASRIETRTCDLMAMSGPSPIRQRMNWRLRDHRLNGMRQFSQAVVRTCAEFDPDVVLTTGISPLEPRDLERIRSTRARLVNFSTDDPWNPVHRAGWFLASLPIYDTIFTPRHANVDDFSRAGCSDVRYLPFAYSPSQHRVFNGILDEDMGCDAIFIGGADADRVAAMSALIRSGVRVHLYGGYWARHKATRSCARGMIDPDGIPRAVAAATVAPCLVRRSNRDGHSMRTFELAAMGACMCLEDTPDHRALFGDDGDLPYFETPDELAQCVKALLRDHERRQRVRAAVLAVMSNAHTYAARLKVIVGAAQG